MRVHAFILENCGGGDVPNKQAFSQGPFQPKQRVLKFDFSSTELWE